MNYPNEPTVTVSENEVTIVIRLADDAADTVWRALFNELAEAQGIRAEALGSRSGDIERTMLRLHLNRGTDAQATRDALNDLDRLCRAVEAGIWERRHKEQAVTIGTHEWWNQQQMNDGRPVPLA